MIIEVVYKGTDGGSATHANRVFTDGVNRFEWFTASDKVDYTMVDKKMVIACKVDEIINGVTYIKNVRVMEVSQ